LTVSLLLAVFSCLLIYENAENWPEKTIFPLLPGKRRADSRGQPSISDVSLSVRKLKT